MWPTTKSNKESESVGEFLNWASLSDIYISVVDVTDECAPLIFHFFPWFLFITVFW